MNGQDNELLAIQLAARVLRKECTIDAGLVRAQSVGALAVFVQSLNTLAGGDYFDFEEMKVRVSDGTASKAMSGRTDSMPLPEPLENWAEDRMSSTPSEPANLHHRFPEPVQESPSIAVDSKDEFLQKFTEGMGNLDRKVRELRSQREEIFRMLFFLERVREKRSDPPRPWIGSVVILIISAFIAGVVFLVLESPAVPAMILVGSGFLAAFLFQREYAWYERLMEIEKADEEHRNRNIQLHKKQIEEFSDQINELKKEALLRLNNLMGSDKERAGEIRKDFVALFKD